MFCSECGSPLESGDAFCPQCGTAVEPDPEELKPSEDSKIEAPETSTDSRAEVADSAPEEVSSPNVADSETEALEPVLEDAAEEEQAPEDAPANLEEPPASEDAPEAAEEAPEVAEEEQGPEGAQPESAEDISAAETEAFSAIQDVEAADSAKCPTCGAALESDDAFCSECGAALPSAASGAILGATAEAADAADATGLDVMTTPEPPSQGESLLMQAEQGAMEPVDPAASAEKTVAEEALSPKKGGLPLAVRVLAAAAAVAVVGAIGIVAVTHGFSNTPFADAAGEPVKIASETLIIPQDKEGKPAQEADVVIEQVDKKGVVLGNGHKDHFEVTNGEGFRLSDHNVPDGTYKMTIDYGNGSSSTHYVENNTNMPDPPQSYNPSPNDPGASQPEAPEQPNNGGTQSTDQPNGNTEEENKPAAKSAAELFAAQCDEYVAAYGEPAVESEAGAAAVKGLSFAALADMTGDGENELVVAYRDAAQGKEGEPAGYCLEVWGYADGAIKKVIELTPGTLGNNAVGFGLCKKGDTSYIYLEQLDHQGASLLDAQGNAWDAVTFKQEIVGCDADSAQKTFASRAVWESPIATSVPNTYLVNDTVSGQAEYDAAFAEWVGTDAAYSSYQLKGAVQTDLGASADDCIALTKGTIAQLKDGKTDASVLPSSANAAAPNAVVPCWTAKSVSEKVEAAGRSKSASDTKMSQTWEYPQFAFAGSENAASKLNASLKAAFDKERAGTPASNSSAAADSQILQKSSRVCYLKGGIAGVREAETAIDGEGQTSTSVRGSLYNLATGEKTSIEAVFDITKSELQTKAIAALQTYMAAHPSDSLSGEELQVAISALAASEDCYYVSEEGIVIAAKSGELGSDAYAAPEVVVVPFADSVAVGSAAGKKY